MEDSLHKLLMDKIKEFENSVLKYPLAKKQSKHMLQGVNDSSNKFQLLINRKGHLNKDNLTLIFHSKNYNEILVRFDVNGASHINKIDQSYDEIPTPHIHIFDEKHYNGKIAIHISSVHDEGFIDELLDSLDFFLEYNNVDTSDLNVTLNGLF